MHNSIQNLKVSIAMATYNGEKYILQQMNSYLSQTHLPYELIISDDQSTDCTVKIIEQFAKNAPFPVKFEINNNRLGYRKNFMATAKKCEGDIIFFSDQDDIWHADKILLTLAQFDQENVLLVYHNAFVIDQSGNSICNLYDSGAHGRLLNSKNPEPFHFSLGFTQAYRSILHKYDDLWPQSIDCSFPTEIEAHDQWYFFLASMFNGVVFLNKNLSKYRQHENNVFGFNDVGNQSRFLKGLKRFLVGPGWDDIGRAKSGLARSAIAAAIALRLETKDRYIARKCAKHYAHFAQSLRLRNDTFHARQIRLRIRSLILNIVNRGYGVKNNYKLKLSWIIVDVIRVFMK